jgi:hypothetical protein
MVVAIQSGGNKEHNQSLHLTANSSAVFEKLCPASKQVVIQGSVLRSVGGS